MPAKALMEGILSHLGFDPALYAVFEICDQETRELVKGCETTAIQGKRLCIRVPSAVHRQELMYSKKRLVERINQSVGRTVVNDIRFELGS